MTGIHNLMPHSPIRIYYIIQPHNLISVMGEIGFRIIGKFDHFAPKFDHYTPKFDQYPKMGWSGQPFYPIGVK